MCQVPQGPFSVTYLTGTCEHFVGEKTEDPRGKQLVQGNDRLAFGPSTHWEPGRTLTNQHTPYLGT